MAGGGRKGRGPLPWGSCRNCALPGVPCAVAHALVAASRANRSTHPEVHSDEELRERGWEEATPLGTVGETLLSTPRLLEAAGAVDYVLEVPQQEERAPVERRAYEEEADLEREGGVHARGEVLATKVGRLVSGGGHVVLAQRGAHEELGERVRARHQPTGDELQLLRRDYVLDQPVPAPHRA